MKKNSKFLPGISIILGTISITWGLLFFGPGKLSATLFAYYEWQTSLYLRIFIPAAIIGLISGIISLKLKLSKISAILGIVFSTIALMIWLFIWFWITAWSIS